MCVELSKQPVDVAQTIWKSRHELSGRVSANAQLRGAKNGIKEEAITDFLTDRFFNINLPSRIKSAQPQLKSAVRPKGEHPLTNNHNTLCAY